ncbi:hypothetical protein [Lysobacter sp. P5_B9]
MTVPQQFEILSGEYFVRPLSFSGVSFIADVQHVHSRNGQSFFTSMAYLTGFMHPDADMTHPHWSVRLFADSRIRYEAQSKASILLWDINLQSKENSDYRKHLKALRDSNLPPIHPELPQELGSALIRLGWCSEPLHVQVYTATRTSSAEFGEVFHDEEN